MPTSVATFVKQYVKALEEGTAALFAGAGLSKPSGFVDWKGLLADVVTELALPPDTENLIAVAQYHVNEKGGRGHLNQVLIDEFTKDAEPNRNHELIAKLPIETIWTTNYDTLLEKALEHAYKRVDVKHQEKQLNTSKPGRHVVLYKMHGDISLPNEAVLVKEDYETYESKRKLFSYQLQGDLVSKTFLFIGFSFTDPNVDYLLARIRGLMGSDLRHHYCFLKRVEKPRPRLDAKGGEVTDGKAEANYQYDKRRQELLIGDLKRYGIQTVLLEKYEEITSILELLSLLVHRRNVFVSGSAVDPQPLGQGRLDGLARKLGATLIQKKRNLTSGIGLGLGGQVVIGAMEALYRQRGGRVDERLTLRPFPQEVPTGMTREQLWTRYREEMLSRAGAVVFVSGNKLVDGDVVLADGCLEEFEIAKKLQCTPIPIGCTGHAAAQVWNEVNAHVEKFYKGHAEAAKAALAILNDAQKTDDDVLTAVFTLLDLGEQSRA